MASEDKKRRRSARLQNAGYYDIEGKPYISYKENIYRLFKRRKRRSQVHEREPTSNDCWDMDWDVDHDINTDNRSNSKCRWSTVLNLKIFAFIMLLLCFGLGHMWSQSLHSGPSGSPATHNVIDKGSNVACEETAKQLRELQDELLKLKKTMNRLLPDVDSLPNFALRTQGARVSLQHSSKPYYTQGAGLTFFGIFIQRPPESPRTVIEGHSRMFPGRCWAFPGRQGHLSIALSHAVTISHVTLGHIGKNVSPTGSISSAPKEFSVYGMKCFNDEGTRLGTFLYDQDGDSLQTFKLPDHKSDVLSYVRLQVESNWGHPDYTCVYNFRVHGKLAG